MYWHKLNWKIDTSTIFRWTVTWDVLTRIHKGHQDLENLMNSNMGCIDTFWYIKKVHEFKWMNSNMGCIDTIIIITINTYITRWTVTWDVLTLKSRYLMYRKQQRWTVTWDVLTHWKIDTSTLFNKMNSNMGCIDTYMHDNMSSHHHCDEQ